MRCWLQRNRVGTTDHILRQCLLRRSCCIRPLQCLNTIHKLLNQSALRLRIQHGKEKQQGRGGGGISPALQITVCAAGNTKLLRHGLLSQCLLLPQRRQFFGKKLCEQRRVSKAMQVRTFRSSFWKRPRNWLDLLLTEICWTAYWFIWSIWRAHPAEIRRCLGRESTPVSVQCCWSSGLRIPYLKEV